jgi:hypothetical protein
MSNINLDIIKEYIEDKRLYEKSRVRDKVYYRHYLAAKLFETNQYKMNEIAALFDRDRTTMIHSIKQHAALKTDGVYLKIIAPVVDLCNDAELKYVPQQRDVFKDLNNANNLAGLRRMKRWLKEGLYEQQIEKL